MSSDYFFDEELNSDIIHELDNIESAHTNQAKAGVEPVPVARSAPALAREDSDFFDTSFNVDEAELKRLDTFIEDAYQGKADPVLPHTGRGTKPMGGPRQMTLFGEVLDQGLISPSKASSSRNTLHRARSNPRNPFGQPARKTKVWDHTAFAKRGVKSGKGKQKASCGWDDEVEEEVEFEQFPAPIVSIGPPPPMKIAPDLLEAKHWIYPLNHPKRDYQYNISKQCLFENTLVALPTGLGKTFIAGVVMLNYYRWFPTGKVIFLAPTKPLVAQQIDACHRTCGIPGIDAAEITGQTASNARGKAWKEKRVFYMTPQTLMSEFKSEACDVSEIVLLVMDEAHKATGDYAYAQVVRYLMAKNPYFRLLALTATPGSTPDAVQAIVDSLHISRIEIRDEGSLDLKEYLHKKILEQHVLKMNDDINKIKDLLVKVMETIIKPLKQSGVFPGYVDVVNMHSFRPHSIIRDIFAKPSMKSQTWAISPLKQLSALARAMGHLFEDTMGMCYNCLSELNQEPDAVQGKKAGPKKLRLDPNFQALMREIEQQRNRGFTPHPKMTKLKALILQHFAGSESGPGEQEQTKAIVFVNYREAVDEIVEELNREQPMIRASRFVGQGTSKHGNKGFAQREQIEIVKKFSQGEYNVLVSTAIGEEGLDIGQVDMIICYDAQKTPIRMLQRVGRTGRKRQGHVHVLLAEQREEHNWTKAQATYSDVQRSIVRGEDLELFGDVERLLPDHIRPECIEKEVDIIEYTRNDPKKRAKKDFDQPAAKRRKRNDDIGRNIPAGAYTGFVSAAELVVKNRGKKKVAQFDPHAADDDDVDRELEAGIFGPRRTVSAPTRKSKASSSKKKISRASTVNETEKKKRRRQESEDEDRFSLKALDDSDDIALERGIIFSDFSDDSAKLPPPTQSRSCSSKSHTPDPPINNNVLFDLPVSPLQYRKHQSPKSMSLSPRPRIDEDIIDLVSDTPEPEQLPQKSTAASPKAPYRTRAPHDSLDEGQEMAWLVAEDDEPQFEFINSSPLLDRKRLPTREEDSEVEIVDETPFHALRYPKLRVKAPEKQHFQADASAIIFEGDNFNKLKVNGRQSHDIEASVEIVGELLNVESASSPRSPTILPSLLTSTSNAERRFSSMKPPELPIKSPASDPEPPEPSFPVRPVRKQAIRRVAVPVPPELESSPVEMPPPSQRRLQKRRTDSSPLAKPRNKKRNIRQGPPIPNPWIDVEAVHSGDEASEGSSHADEIESESDRQFLKMPPETQISPSYNQTLAYRQSLLSQAPCGSKVPAFANRPVRRGLFGAWGNSKPRVNISSSPRRDDDMPNEYELGTFVVDDDEEIPYIENSSEL